LFHLVRVAVAVLLALVVQQDSMVK